jgi:hypothetical protein
MEEVVLVLISCTFVFPAIYNRINISFPPVTTMCLAKASLQGPDSPKILHLKRAV